MAFIPFERMRARIDQARSESDVAVFHDLLYFGELVLKSLVAGLVAGIRDEPDRLRYRQAHRLVRADGIGDWASVADEVLLGPPAQHHSLHLRDSHVALTERNPLDTWQYSAVASLREASDRLGLPRQDPLRERVQGKQWLSEFVELRNKTRGHGAVRPAAIASAVPALQRAVEALAQNLPIFTLPWAFVRRNLSGKYRVSPMGATSQGFVTALTKDKSLSLPDGVYLLLDVPKRVELVISDPDLCDFYVPNGAFKGSRYEVISYISGATMQADASAYLQPAAKLPQSETQGIGGLDVQGNGFGNLPPPPGSYVQRPALETELQNALLDERHPVVTLHGPGGIGKTSLTLTVLHRITQLGHFSVVLWFSARDVELTLQGPKPVRPHVLSEADIATEYVKLVGSPSTEDKKIKPKDYLAESLTLSPHGRTLFVFDNFETVQSPADIYQWLNSRIRLPNKVLITTRFREFKGDYPVEVSGMTEEESLELIRATSSFLGISDKITSEYAVELHNESSGHPYVMKILLGEVAKVRQLVKIERIVASSDEILTALFERTYRGLSPAARRMFFTVCNWRSTIPLVGLRAVVLRPANERIDVDDAIEALERSSFIELVKSELDGELFVTVPLASAVFGRRKLQVDPMKAAVEADSRFLRDFGAIQDSEVRRGLRPRLERLFKQAARATSHELSDYISILQLVANTYPTAWLLLAELYNELNRDGDDQLERLALLKFLEEAPPDASDRVEAWRRLAAIARRMDDPVTEVHALVELSVTPDVSYDLISEAANQVNALFRNGDQRLEGDEKVILIKKLIEAMEQRIAEADAAAFSRLAWLCLNLRDVKAAESYVNRGLRLQPDNMHCQRLAERLGIETDLSLPN